MHIDILTLFPEMFSGYIHASILGRAQSAKLLTIDVVNIRDYATDKHSITDEPPYGGGGGMVLKPGPLFRAVENLVGQSGESQPPTPDTNAADGTPQLRWPIILLTPQGRLFNHQVARELVGQPRLTFICGRYEGVDERVRQYLVTDEVSIGDFVLTGGEIAALAVVDAIARLIPGALGAEGAAASDSHAAGLLEGPHYTRPASFRGIEVPDILRSGHEKNIRRWQREQAIRRTWQRRPELLLSAEMNEDDRRFLASLAEERVRAIRNDSE